MDSWMVRPPGMDGSSKEKAHVMHLDGRTWDLREIDSATAMPITQIDSEENKPRHFLWLGSEGIRVLCKQRPLDELIYLLRSEVRDIKYFVDVYGQDQVCAWLLAILCQNIGQVHPSLMPQDIGFHSHLVKRHFFFYGGSPVRQPVTSHQTVLGTSVVPSTLQHSGCYRGLDLYVKRLIAPYWKKTLFKKLSSYQYALAIPEHLFQTAQRELAKLIQFTEEWHPPPSDSSMFTERSTHVSVGSGGPLESRGGGSVTGNAGGGGGSLSWYQEKPYLLELFQFIQLTYEAVRFVLILIRMRLPDIASNLPASQKLIPDELATQPFEFLVTEQGRQFCGQIATFLVQHAALYYPTESLSPQFRDMCPHLLPVDDIYTAMVLEKLDNLGTLNIPVCEEALSIVLNVAGKLKLRQFTIITEKFTKLGFARGVLDLALRRAMEIDLEDRAVAYVEEGQPDQDPRRVLVKQRYECYYAILNALDTLNQLLEKEPTPILESHRASSHAQALESKDKLWHFALYEWYTRTNLASVLDLKTLYLEDWLNSPPVWEKANDLTKTEASSCLSLYEKQKLLAQYYVIQKKFENASLVLFNLATVPSDQLTLEERIYFLKEASQTVRACNHTELQKKMRDVLDVASVQLTYHSLPFLIYKPCI
ncbi:hypothetical protein HMI54_008533 [Coelomomyces lativittatus]|nr:hypothetical protein HMI54_008533 [Coelomomyces lativittatus]